MLNWKTRGQPLGEPAFEATHPVTPRTKNLDSLVGINAVRATAASDDVAPPRDLLETAFELGHRDTHRTRQMSSRVFVRWPYIEHDDGTLAAPDRARGFCCPPRNLSRP